MKSMGGIAGCMFMVVSSVIWVTGCAGTSGWQPLPRAEANAGSKSTLVWNGKGEAWRPLEGGWSRDSTYDYSFTVVQERQGSAWHSIKTLQRTHPAYDGKAGPRAQTYSFEIEFRPEDQALASKVRSTLGDGKGISDLEFRKQILEIELPKPGRFNPFTHFQITQHYQYEEGRLEETVELVNRRGDEAKPFMKVEERADIFQRGPMAITP